MSENRLGWGVKSWDAESPISASMMAYSVEFLIGRGKNKRIGRKYEMALGSLKTQDDE
jgi:hypothetical protein